LKDIVSTLDPQDGFKPCRTAIAPAKAIRKARSVKIYKNPHTGEVIQTMGGNHKTLKEWKAEYGSDTVESWLA